VDTVGSQQPIPFGHDSLLTDAKAFDPSKLQCLIAMGVTNVEVDVGYRAGTGKFYVSHDPDARDVTPAQDTSRTLASVVHEFRFVDLGLEPHLDVKFSASDQAVGTFETTLNGLPDGLKVTISGRDWTFLARLASNPRVQRTLFTVDSQNQVRALLSRAASLRASVPGDIGVSLRDNLATQSNLQELRQTVGEIVVWTVNIGSEAKRLAALGVFGITTDSPDVVASLSPPAAIRASAATR
jgi:hypothetical protein